MAPFSSPPGAPPAVCCSLRGRGGCRWHLSEGPAACRDCWPAGWCVCRFCAGTSGEAELLRSCLACQLPVFAVRGLFLPGPSGEPHQLPFLLTLLQSLWPGTLACSSCCLPQPEALRCAAAHLLPVLWVTAGQARGARNQLSFEAGQVLAVGPWENRPSLTTAPIALSKLRWHSSAGEGRPLCCCPGCRCFQWPGPLSKVEPAFRTKATERWPGARCLISPTPSKFTGVIEVH